MDESASHKVSFHLSDVWPHRPHSYEIDHDQVTLPLLHRAITKSKELLENDKLTLQQQIQVFDDLIGLVSNEDRKLRAITEDGGQLVDTVSLYLNDSDPVLRAKAAQVVSELATITEGKDSLASNGYALPYLVELLLCGDTSDLVNGVDDISAEGHKWAAHALKNFCTSVSGCNHLSAKQTKGDVESLLPSIINAGLRGGSEIGTSVEDILFTLTSLARSNINTCEHLLHERALPAALQFLPQVNHKSNDKQYLKTFSKSFTHPVVINAVRLVSALSTHSIGQDHVIDHDGLLSICALMEPVSAAIKTDDSEVASQILLSCAGIISLCSTPLEGKIQISSSNNIMEIILKVVSLVDTIPPASDPPLHARLSQTRQHLISALKGASVHPPSKSKIEEYAKEHNIAIQL